MNILDPNDRLAFRHVLGQFVTGMTIVTAALETKAAGIKLVGMTCQSFTSVSLEPPLVAFFAGRNSGSWAAIKEAGAFCVNVLSGDQQDLARVFATPGIDKFAGVLHRPAPSRSPVLDGVLAWIDCTVEHSFPAGDHDGVLGRIQAFGLGVAAEGKALLYHRGAYRELSL